METKCFALIVFLCCFSLSMCASPKFKACDSSKYLGQITNVTVDCKVDGGEVQLKKGTNVTVSFQFKMKEGSANGITAVVHGIIAGVPIPFSLANANACKGCGMTCPITAPNAYDYKSVIPVKSEYPNLRLVVKWQLSDENKQVVWCVEMPAAIVS